MACVSRNQNLLNMTKPARQATLAAELLELYVIEALYENHFNTRELQF